MYDLEVNLTAAVMAVIAAHKDQKDRAGVPFYHHLLRVGIAMSPDSEGMIIGFLHDIVEDTSIDLESIGDNFGPYVMAHIDLLTRRPEETYWNYLDRLIQGSTGLPVALLVKRQDLLDNLLPWRQNFPGAGSLKARHLIALRQVEEVLISRGLLNESERYNVVRGGTAAGTTGKVLVKPGWDADLASSSFTSGKFTSHLPTPDTDDDPF